MNLIKKQNRITAEDILSKITSYDIYRYYLGDFKINKKFKNPFYKDTNASLAVFVHNGELFHKDLGEMFFRGSCFNLVMQIHSCSYADALKIIDRDFRLGLSDSTIGLSPLQIEWPKPEIKEKRPPFIQVKYRKPNKDELDYWAKFGVTDQNLKDNNVLVPSEIWVNRRKQSIKESELVFCYYFPEDIERFPEGSFKIYRPMAEKQRRWYSNTTFSYVDNLKSINNCERAFITKSKKEFLMFKNLLGTDCICTVQAENPAAISDETLQYIKNNSKEQYVCSDSDEAGKIFSWFLTKNWGYKHINAPDHYLNMKPRCTDLADVAQHYGIDKVIEHLKNKGII